VDDTGFPRQGKHSVGVARHYCGQIGKHDNCQAAVSLSVSTWSSSLPIAWRLYLPEVWRQDAERRRQAVIPEEIAVEKRERKLSRLSGPQPCIAAYGFLVSERNRFPPQHAPAMLDYPSLHRRQTSGRAARRVRPERHNPNSIATLRTVITRILPNQLPHCPFCGSRSA
jgi:hypothetical protein